MSRQESYVKPDVLKYRPVDEYAPKYKFTRVAMSNVGTNIVTIQSGATQEVQFTMPANTVFNLHESILPYELQIPNTGIVDETNVTFEDTFEIGEGVYFGTAAGSVDLCNLNEANKYLKIRSKMTTPIKDVLTNDALGCLKACNVLEVNNLQATPYAAAAGNIYNVIPAANTYHSSVNYIEPQYLYKGAAEGNPLPALNARRSAVSRYRHFKLGNIKDTIFAMNKDLYFGANEMVIRFKIPSHNKIGFKTDDPADLEGNCSPIATDVKINEFFLWLAVETNEELIKQLVSKYNSGSLKMQIPFTTAFKKSTTGAGTVSVPLTFNRTNGKKIKRILHTVWHPNEQLNHAYDCDNWNGRKVISYRTHLDSNPIQNTDISCRLPVPGRIGHEDWFYNKKYSKDSAILNGAVYQHNWHHVDQFYEDNESTNVPDENLDVGLPMTLGNQLLNRTWQITLEATGDLSHITYATFLRDIAITPDGVFLDANGPLTSVTANTSVHVRA